MKKRLFLLALLTSLSLSSCDALNNIINGDKTSQEDDDKKKDPVIESIYLTGSLSKSEYIVDESWSKEGLGVAAKYSGDKEDEELAEDKYFIVFDSEVARLGITEIIATAYLKNSSFSSEPVTYNVTVSEKEEDIGHIESISIKGDLETTHYYEGELWDTTGLSVEATYSSGKKETLDPSEYSFYFSEEKPEFGNDTVQITAYLLNDDLESQPVTFEIYVEEPVEPIKELESLEISGNLEKTFYEEGDNWNSAGLTVKGVYDNGDKSILSNGSYYFVFNPANPVVGTHSVKIQAILSTDDNIFSPEVSYDVTVKRFVSLRILGDLENKNYEEDDPWNFEGLQVEGTYNDAGSTSVVLNSNEYRFECTPEYATLGTTSVSIKASFNKYTLESEARSFNVTVTEKETPPVSEESTIIYNSNGGTGTMTPSTGINPEVKACTFTAPKGYTFDYWNSDPKGEGTTYNVGAHIGEDITLYAIWKEKTSSGYYSDVSGKGTALIESIEDTITKNVDYTAYSSLRFAYVDTDVRDDGYLYDIYSDNTHYVPGSKHENYKNVGDAYNKEHTIPKSWWGGAESKQGADLFIVLPSDGKVNGMRSNVPYGITTTGTSYKLPNDPSGNRLGNSTSTEYVTGQVFEPFDSRKGDLARIYFYAAAMYWESGANNGPVKKWTSGDGSKVFSNSGNNGFVQKYLNMLLKWHKEDPVSDWEIGRNDKVHNKQGNRNPFVDHPSWVDIIWGGKYEGKNSESYSAGTVSGGVIS